jgi:carboxyl-terminal processing protease
MVFSDIKVMIERFSSFFLLVFLGFNLSAAPATGINETRLALATSPDPASSLSALTIKSTSIPHITPGPVDGHIAYLTAQMLEQLHYTRQPFDHAVSSKFFDRYFEALDPQHLHFTQADIAEFEHYRTALGDLTVNRRHPDTRPACEIFNRYMERLQQRVDFAINLLQKEKFTFDGKDRIAINRHEMPYPKDLDEAQKLWRERLKFEYLDAHLSKIESKKKAETVTPNQHTNKPAAGSAPKTQSEHAEIVEMLTRRYQRNLHAFAEWNNDDVLQWYLTTLAHVYDPHSDYFGHAQLDQFAIGMNLSLFGIGAELMTEEGYCTIRRLLPGGPAEKSKKIKEKDRIVAVAQGSGAPVDVVEMSINKAVQLIRGPKGSEVRLTVIPDGADNSKTTVVTLIRDEIKLEDQEAKAKVIDLPNDHGGFTRMGFIDLPSFYARMDLGSQKHIASSSPEKIGGNSTSADVDRLLKKLKEEHVKGVILDLRRNGGGSLEEAIKLTGLFIKKGPVVQVREPGKDGAVQVDYDLDERVSYDGPLIVLTSRFSASASEIVAGALQDYGRALIIGDSSTHGKGTVQSVNQLAPYLQLPPALSTNDPGALKITIKKFYRASGVSTQLRGVTPDIVLPSVLNESKDIGESALDNPLPCDVIPKAKYEHLPDVDPYLPELRKRSSERVASEKDFNYVREDVELFKKQQANKTISLNEKERLKEKAEADARQKLRDKERLARKESAEKIYELTVRQTDLPGLPPAVVKTNNLIASTKGKPGRLASGNGGGATNSASVSIASPKRDPLNDDAEEDHPPAVDVDLVEAEHILLDYLALLPAGNLGIKQSDDKAPEVIQSSIHDVR